MKFKFSFLAMIALSTFCVSQSYALNCNQKGDEIIKLYQLLPNETEGGYFKLTYKLDDEGSDVPKSTAIFYLLKNENRSLFHKLSSDIMYHFYSGDPVTMVLLNPNGTGSTLTLGSNVLRKQQVQVVIPKNTWIGSYVAKGGCYALMGTTMTPGFDPKGYELGNRSNLTEMYPQYKHDIFYLTNYRVIK